MITWHKCSEKMPERGEFIVLYSPIWKVLEPVLYTSKTKDKKTWFVDMINVGDRDPEWRVYTPDYLWAYASEFNFPETKDE